MKDNLLFSFGLIGEIGFATALPLVLFGKLGEYLDNRYYPNHRYFFYAGVALAMIQTFFYLLLIVKKAAKEAERLSK